MDDFINDIANEIKRRNNPIDLKEGLIGYVQQLEPLIVSINNGSILLQENANLFISETFRLRCNIDKTTALSSGVPSDCKSATSLQEMHSYGGAACMLPDGLGSLSSAILAVRDELLALKCNLQKGDKVLVISMDIKGCYTLTDKVL